MTQRFSCGDHDALVSYLYDECEPQERLAIGAHVAVCEGCAEELGSLGTTRERLGGWRPPDVQLGFRVVSDVASSKVPGSSRRWQRPMPAWAQAAAAVVVFATGVTLGVRRGATTSTPPRELSAAVSSAEASGATASAVTRGDLSALEQRLRGEIARMRVASGPGQASPGDSDVLQRVRAMIEDSERRQQRELALRTSEVMRDFDAQRRVDLTRIERTLGQMDGTTGVEVEQQRQMLDYLMRVSQRGQ
jgi:hypothetical protein